ncbi:MAG: PAC2 family protein [Candidatus Nanopelagicales bacterium]|nr:PAC2 family protein [Candidatus Nanopelagicales bacterium]
MIGDVPWPSLREPVMITAFEGWNDAGEAATDAIDHLREVFDAELLAELDPDDYYDFQVNRPHVHLADSERRISWPTTKLFVSRAGDRDVVLIHGIEPNIRWRAFCQELLGAAQRLNVGLIVNVGSLLADVPHTRPVPTSAFATEPRMLETFDVEPAMYEGPTGIVGVLQHTCDLAGFSAISLWAAVPHYVANNPCPKATLALLQRLDDVLDLEIPVGDLPEQAEIWQRGVDQMAAQDSDVAEYVSRLENARDSELLKEGSGDVIAAEFERYLRRQGRGE